MIKSFILFYLGLMFFFYTPLVLSKLNTNMAYFQGDYKGFNLGSGLNSTISKKDFMNLRDKGFQLFRVNLKQNYNPSTGLIELTGLSEIFLQKVHKDLSDLDMKLIISVIFTKKDWRSPNFEKKLLLFWRDMATRYRADETVIAFDIVNEPVPPLSSRIANERLWRNIAISIVEEIRVIGNKIIIYEPAPWGLAEGFKWLQPLRFENIVYSFHMYSPHKFTHQGVRSYKKGYSYPNLLKGWDLMFLKRVIEPVIAFQKKYSVSIYVGEFSAVRYAPGNSRARYIKDLLGIWRDNNWTWTYHSYKEWDGWDPEIISTNPKNKQRVFDSNIMKMLVDY